MPSDGSSREVVGYSSHMSFLSSIARSRVLSGHWHWQGSCAQTHSSFAWLRPRGFSTCIAPSVSQHLPTKGYTSGYAFNRRVTSRSPVNTRHKFLSQHLRLSLRRAYCALRPMSTPPTGSTTAQSNVPEDEHRLPLDVKPTHYDLTILTDLEKLTFEGSVIIE